MLLSAFRFSVRLIVLFAQISAETTDLLIEVTSTVNLDACKRVLQETLQGMLEMGLGSRDAPAAHQDSDDDDITFEGVFLHSGEPQCILALFCLISLSYDPGTYHI